MRASFHTLALLLLTLAIVACDGGGSRAAGSSSASSRDEQKPVGMADVCAGGTAAEGVAPYVKKDGEVSPVEILFREASDGAFVDRTFLTFLQWSPQGFSTTRAPTQLVACVTVAKKAKVRECPFEAVTRSQAKGTRWVDQYDATYALSLREAASGKVLAEKTVDLTAPAQCPSIFDFAKEREAEYPKLEGVLLALMAPFQGSRVALPTVEPDALAIVCGGIGLPGTAKYSKQSGTISPLALLRRWRTEGWKRYAGPSFYDDAWKSEDVYAHRLVACMTTEPGEPKRTCPFDDNKAVEVVDATHRIAIHEATTGTKLDERTFQVPARKGCPSFWTFGAGQTKDLLYDDPGDDAKAWLAGYAAAAP